MAGLMAPVALFSEVAVTETVLVAVLALAEAS